MEPKLTQHHLESGAFHEHLSHLQHTHNLSDAGKGRVSDAVSAALQHVQNKHGLRYGMAAHHVDDALHFIDKEHRDLKPKERAVIEQALKHRFDIKEPEQGA